MSTLMFTMMFPGSPEAADYVSAEKYSRRNLILTIIVEKKVNYVCRQCPARTSVDSFKHLLISKSL